MVKKCVSCSLMLNDRNVLFFTEWGQCTWKPIDGSTSLSLTSKVTTVHAPGGQSTALFAYYHHFLWIYWVIKCGILSKVLPSLVLFVKYKVFYAKQPASCILWIYTNRSADTHELY